MFCPQQREQNVSALEQMQKAKVTAPHSFRKKTEAHKSVALLIPYRPEGREDLLKHLQQGLLPAGGDVVLGQL